MSTRTSFLVSAPLAAGALALGARAAPAVARASPVAAASTVPPLAFDRAAFEAILSRPYRHKQVFATTSLHEGLVLHYMRNSLTAYAVGFGEGPGTMHVAAVTYGPALALALDDGAWADLSLARYLETFGEKFGPELVPGKNPFADQVAALVADGASFFVCNNALHGVANSLALLPFAGGRDTEAVYARMARATLPGATIVPAGVAALNAAQEAHFTFVQATVA
ncbi:MAG: hypothetical protein ACREM2_07730 [Vulcanimicrobiaceae bacterium]